MKSEIIESTVRHISPIAKSIREADLLEILAAGSNSPYDSLWDGHRMSNPGYTFIVDNKPVCMFGVVPFEDNPRWGTIWMLGTDDITDKYSFQFLRWSKRFLPTLMEPYEMVCNIVDARNTVHIRWIKWMGFKFIRQVVFGPENRLFWEFAEVNHV